ncbi:cobalt ABC transporter permease [Ponticoccus alexandrii]|uniref:Cobalt ABC transporter permease n=1 Tax=Ponticoccus alexandrii TaxID=1943633 RepID=A0ABX7F4S4_9RHOB|nr:cobalt ABC transporter permease [Ponticoccus alexandrii]KID12681.1 cobalt ABC transporter permease [Rhodobacteraceae bacterium PD-2]QRF65245.1 cobalt ABC transporter permease [Ponticoccus alexandrii]
MRRLAMILALCALPLPALAHKVIASVFPSGDSIEGEIGFSNGDMAVGQTVTVYGPDGAELGTTETDDDGFFVFTPAQPVAHTFRADLGAGHVADVTMSAEDVAKILGQEPIVTETPEDRTPAAPVSMSDQQRAIMAEIVRDEMRPLRREIAAYREKNDLQSILGGMGYIAGLFGLGFYLAARRKLKDAA